MKNKWLNLILVTIVICLGFVALYKNKPEPAPTSQKIQITASFYPLYFFTSEITGDKADVFNVTPAGSEPHDYEPTVQDIIQIQKSKLLIINGGKLEPWADKIKNDLEKKHIPIEVVSEPLINLTMSEEVNDIIDPHVWLSPNLAITIANNIRFALIKIDPKNESYYTKNYFALSEKLDALDKTYQKKLSNCKSKNIITSHAAFGYLAKTYGLNQVSIAGLSPDAEPSTKQLVEIAMFANNNNVKYIFFETLISPKLSETIASEIGAKTLVLDPIEGISDDEIKAGKNYITVMQDNLKNLQIALQCK